MTRGRIALWSAVAFTALAVEVHLGLFVGGLMGASLLLQAAHWFTDLLGGVLLAAAVLAVASGCTDWMHNRSKNDHESATFGQRNETLLTSVGEAPTSIARLKNAVPDSALARCYDPGRGTFILRSCGGL